tara:strand:- start:1497 stop:1751 length:255 start_codon:yes stop_codon:yes gene_type:complete
MECKIMSTKNIEELKANIENMEKELAEAKKAYREMKTKGLKEAMEAKKMADEAVKEELKALGYNYNTNSSYSEWNPFTGWRTFL